MKGWRKQRVHVLCVVLYCSLEVFVPLCFFWSLLFKCLESIFNLSHPLPSFPPFVRAMVPKMVVRKQCSLGGKQRLNLWFACGTFIRLLVLSCCGCDALSSLHISIHVSSFLLCLVACILQGFQTITVSHCYVTPSTLKAVVGVRCTTGMRGVSHVSDCPQLSHSVHEVTTRNVFSTEFRVLHITWRHLLRTLMKFGFVIVTINGLCTLLLSKGK